jgi:serine/threonine protein kinase/nitrous oxidase accessory protein NosD
MAEAEPLTVGPEPLGRYQLLRKLGEGGMGTVYLANDSKLDRHVAVKILPPHSVNDPAAVGRFQREAKALAQLSHPGIIQAFDSDEANGRHFLVMEFVEGMSLAQVVKEQGRLAPSVAADYVYQAAVALQHAHSKGLVHRDLKPSNLLLSADGRVKLLDLGLARFLQDQVGDPELTRDGAGMGTPDYAAPEQFLDAHKADARSDIYALGCTLYHLLAGQVPFPGSSLHEKRKAHEIREPAPLNELCPQASAGLVVVVARMMAKRPEDRFQTAAEVADALAGHVASSSPSFQALKNTLTWQAGQRTLTQWRARTVGMRWALAGAAVTALLLIGVVLIWQPFGAGIRDTSDANLGTNAADRQQPSDSRKDDTKGTEKEPKDKTDKPPGKKSGPPWEEPNVLTVAKDGSAQFKSINVALDQVKPGQTIRVLDDQDYDEALNLSRPASFNNITLEAVKNARLVAVNDRQAVLSLIGVSGVTVRGFRLRADAENVTLIFVQGKCPGLLLEQIEMKAGQQAYNGMEFRGAALDAEDPPVVVQDCIVHKAKAAFMVMGVLVTEEYSYRQTSRIILRNNLITDSYWGFMIAGDLKQIQVVGNRITNALQAGIHLEQFHRNTSDIVIANNTVSGCRGGLRVWDSAIKGKAIHICNNLLLDCRDTDFLVVDTGGKPGTAKGPGQGASLHDKWRISNNWRELGRAIVKEDPWYKGIVPPGPDEKQLTEIKVMARDPKSPDFLRPAADSPLATEGAGKTDPSLPRYIGALPPPGVPKWDWSRTWQTPPPGVLLTVSKEPSDKGQYRTLNEALAAAKPWATIRVLDSETYTERLVLDNAKKHEGIVVEATAGATVNFAGTSPRPWIIEDVPNVRLRGFRFRNEPKARLQAFLNVKGHVPGTMLEDLDMQADGRVNGINLHNIDAERASGPLVIQRCTLSSALTGIVLSPGLKGAANGVVVHGNQLKGATAGVFLDGYHAGVQVTSNLFSDCKETALHLQDPGNDLHDLLIANNSAYDCVSCLRQWNNDKSRAAPQAVLVINNLFCGASDSDIGCFETTEPGSGEPSLALAALIAKRWRFANNWRDLSGFSPSGLVPLAGADQKLDKSSLLSLKAGSADFLRPSAELFQRMRSSRVLIGPPLPSYAGAVPPAGVQPWDWQITWRAFQRSRAAAKSDRK